ncbi:MAG TPA: hypothetical protein VFU45_07090 [Gemmatimonadales bacterium]|nr:hypothetical protein [Gemmatimonadales bacterium]
MSRLSRWLVRTAFLYLVVALALGVLLVWRPALAQWPVLRRAAPTQLHLFVVGWITQLIAGVAYWLFPRTARGAPPEDWRGWWVYGGLNLGLLLRAAAEPWAGSRWSAGVLPLSAALQFGAGLLLAITLWPRARAR